MSEVHDNPFSRLIPVFPLPQCVLLPNAILPLHIFEPRYVSMIRRECLEQPSEGYVAIALLKGDYEAVYATHFAPIHRVLCVGKVIECESLPEGRYNILLVGQYRARILLEDANAPYRRAILKRVDPDYSGSADQEREIRFQLRAQTAEAALKGLQTHLWNWPEIEEFLEQQMPLSDIVDCMAHAILEADDFLEKQRILEEARVLRRGELLLDILRQKVATFTPPDWPPKYSTN